MGCRTSLPFPGSWVRLLRRSGFGANYSRSRGLMSGTTRNFVIAYVLLVGLPLAGLAGVLRAGRSLTAPMSVDGVWKVQADASPVNAEGCSHALTSLSNSSLVISQSGKSVMLSFEGSPKASGSGTLEGQSLRGSVIASDSSASACGSDQQITLAAAIDPKADPKSLTGVLSVSGCPSCAEIKISATRLPRTRTGEVR